MATNETTRCGDDETVTWDDPSVWDSSGFTAFLEKHGIKREDLIAPPTSGVPQEERRFFRYISAFSSPVSLSLTMSIWLV
jgi:hypothetical protein